MTSRHPGTMPPGTTGRTAFTGHSGRRGKRGTADGRGHPGPAPRWPAPVLPVAALIIVGLAGLQGEVTAPRWDGPLHGDPVAVGIALEIVLGVMLAITVRRLAVGAHAGAVKTAASAVAVKLRRLLAVMLGAGMIAVAVTTPVGVHEHLFSGAAGTGAGQGPGVHPGQAASARPSRPAAAPGARFHFHLFSLHLYLTAYLLYGLLALMFLGAVALRMWVVRQYRSSRKLRAYHYLGPFAPDSQDLLEAVESGRSALRAIDDARAAIIACYVAMEASLDERGAARVIADTPDELLTRATAMGIVRGSAATRLTALFYEARFSTHALDRGHRDAAARALAELAGELAGAGNARTAGNAWTA